MSDETAREVGPEEVEAGGNERRRSPRYLCEGFAEAVVVQPESIFRGEIRDISLAGCFVKTAAVLHVTRGAEVHLRFILNGNRYNVVASVTDVRPQQGVGLEFQFVHPLHTEWLPDLIKTLDEDAPSTAE